jgi:hypothetical protein
MAVDLAYDESGEGDVLLVSMQIGMTATLLNNGPDCRGLRRQ